MEIFPNIINEICVGHAAHSSNCLFPDFVLPVEGERLFGLGVKVDITCRKCKYSYSCHLQGELKKDGPGRKQYKANINLALSLAKTSVAMNDVQFIFAALELPIPWPSALTKLIKKGLSTYQDLNVQQMAENCAALQRMAIDTDKGGITVLTDTCYNNSPKGRAMYQPGTQAITPMLEAVTGLPVAVAAHSKLGGTGTGPAFPEHVGMDRAEIDAATENFLAVTKRGVTVNSVVSDGTSKVIEGIKKTVPKVIPEKQECTVHVSRAQRRKFYKCSCSFSEELLGKKSAPTYSYRRTALCESLVKRCSIELKQAVAQHRSSAAITKAIARAARSIVPCFQGNHEFCASSFVCTGNPSGK